MNTNKESVSDALCLSIFNNKHAWKHVTSWIGIVAQVYVLLNFEDKIPIRRGECSIPFLTILFWKYLFNNIQ
jgi:hypothetical protein